MPSIIIQGFKDTVGGVTFTYQSQSANFTAVNNHVYGVDTTTAAVTATLPASAAASSIIFFTDEVGNFGTNNLTIVPAAGETILGDTEWTLSSDYELVALVKGDGTDWVLLGAQTSNVSGAPTVIQQGGVTQIIAGANILLNPPGGTGAVTIEATPTAASGIENGTSYISIANPDGDISYSVNNIPYGFLGFYGAANYGNVAIGPNAMGQSTLGVDNYSNIALGPNALYNNVGFRNVAIGDDALFSNTTGVDNVAIGPSTLWENTTGQLNIALGNSALYDVTTGESNIGIGENALGNITTGQNNVGIGSNCSASSPTVSNEITLGNGSIATLRCAVTSITSLSDARDKKDVQNLPLGLDFVSTLRPVTFVWDTRDGSKKDIPAAGFIAQELQAAEEGIYYLNLVSDSNPDKLEATPGNLIPVLVKAIQDLKEIVDAQAVEIAELKATRA